MKSISFKKFLIFLLKTVRFVFKYLLLALAFCMPPSEQKEDADEEYLEFLRTVYEEPIP